MSRAADETIRRLERLALASWPPLEEAELDGWVIGTSGAYTRRANCVLPLAPVSESLETAVAEVENRYAVFGGSAVFKLTKASEPEGLDAFLASQGYARNSETVVMLRPEESEPVRVDQDAESDGRFDALAARPSAAWLEASYAFSSISPARRADYVALLDGLRAKPTPCTFGGFTVDGSLQSVAMSVICEGVASFQQVATDPAARGRGYAEQVMRGLLALASDQGATSAMLSVEAENASAQRLYDRLGFREVYRYWYRER